MSDSDSDDDLLLSGPVFRKNARQERAADKKREKGLAYLETSLQEEQKRKALNDNITKIKQENWECNEEALMTQAEETIANESNNKRKATEHSNHETNNNNSGLAALALRDQLATAVDTAQASSLGTRRVLSRASTENQWSTLAFAKEDLADIVKRLQAKKGKNAFRNALVSLLKHHDHLEQVLLQRKLAVLCEKHQMTHLPNELTEWLLCLACNPIDGEGSGTSEGAFQTLVTIWTRTHGSPKNPLLTMQDFVRDFEAWFSLSLDSAESNSSSAALVSTSTVSVNGLEHFLLLWERAFLNDIVALDESSPEKVSTQCMVALASVSLDPSFYQYPGLLKALQRATGAFLAFVARNVVSDHASLKDWVASTVTAVLDQCKKLRTAASVDKHKDDDELWLCLSLLARSISTFDDCTSKVDDIHRQFRATLAIQALQMCLEIDDWDKHLQTVLSERGETELPVRASSSLAWRAIASTYAAFLTIPSLGSAVTKNGQRCLATVKLMTYCMLAGVTSHSSPIDLESQDSESNGVLGTTQEATLFMRAVDVIESEGRQLASRVSAFSSDPNFSRAEYLLSCLRRYGDQVRLKARTVSGQSAGSPTSVQKTIHNYFGASCSPEN